MLPINLATKSSDLKSNYEGSACRIRLINQGRHQIPTDTCTIEVGVNEGLNRIIGSSHLTEASTFRTTTTKEEKREANIAQCLRLLSCHTRVRIPSTSSMLSIIVKFVLYLSCEKNENKQKEAGFGPFFKRIKKMRCPYMLQEVDSKLAFNSFDHLRQNETSDCRKHFLQFNYLPLLLFNY